MAKREDPATWDRMWELFHEALELPRGERRAFLERECGSNTGLLGEVEGLLAAHDDGEDPLARSPTLILRSEGSTDGARGAVPGGDPGTALSAGVVLASRFEIVRPLGRGGMGAVYEAYDRELGATVALKTLRPEMAHDRQAQERFRREIHLARQVTHPNVCRIHDLFRHEDLLFLAMEHVPGVTLAERLEAAGPLDLEQALPVAEQVAAALDAAHQAGIVHRDLKCSNVMLVEQGTTPRVVVTDFGLARVTGIDAEGALHLTQTGQLLGTPAFMAPEQFKGDPGTPATDVYAFGVVLYQAVTGELPFTGDTPYMLMARRLQTDAPSPRRHLPDLDRRWERAILRCLERDPRDRFQNAPAVVAALRGERTARRWLPRRRSRRLAGVALMLLAVVAVGGWIGMRLRPATASSAAIGPIATSEEPTWVLLAGFENHTDEPVLDGTLETVLHRELTNSRLVKVVPRQRIIDTLRLMRRPLDTRIDATVGREICIRDGAIRALIAGSVEKLGSTYVLTADLIEPTDGVTIASVSDEAETEEEISATVRRLSGRVRASLGESLSQIRVSNRVLAAVTTPSLRALQLYTEAGIQPALVRTDDENRRAEVLLREAIREDPGFALAHLALADSIWRRGRPADEYLPHVERAIELSDTASEWERQLIRGTHARMTGDLRGAVAAYEAAAQLEPEFDVAMIMVIRAFELTEFDKAVPHALAWTEAQPNFFPANMEAARALAIWAGDPTAAAPYVVRARELLPYFLPVSSMSSPRLYEIGWVIFYPAHERWLQGDLDGVLHEAEAVRADLPKYKEELRDWLAGRIVDYYIALGKLSAAEEVLGLSLVSFTPAARGSSEALIAWARRDGDRLAAGLTDLAAAGFEEGSIRPVTTLLAARAGFAAGARKTVAMWKETPLRGRRPPTANIDIVEGELALAAGDPRKAVGLLEPAVHKVLPSGWTSYFIGAETLARAHLALGDRERARRVLEDASSQRLRAEDGSAKLFWLNLRWSLAELLRDEGRVADAEAIEAELRRLTALADQDFWLVEKLSGVPDAPVSKPPSPPG